MLADRLLDAPKEERAQTREGAAAAPVGPVRYPGIVTVVASSFLQLFTTWLAVVVWFAPDAVVGVGSPAAGRFLKLPSVRVVAVVVAAVLWTVHLLEAWYGFMVASNVPQLRPFRWRWAMATCALGYPSLRLLVADANRARQFHGLKHAKGARWGIIASMMVKPNPAHFGIHDSGIMPGTLRYKLEHFVEGTKVQIFVLLLVLVDIVAVMFELALSGNIVEFVEGVPGHEIEQALHWTSVGILSLFLCELFILMYACCNRIGIISGRWILMRAMCAGLFTAVPSLLGLARFG